MNWTQYTQLGDILIDLQQVFIVLDLEEYSNTHVIWMPYGSHSVRSLEDWLVDLGLL